MDNAERLDRLKTLKYMLENHDEIFTKPQGIAFDLDSWAEKDTAKGCLTTACALGSAACYPPFMKLGLRNDEHFIDSLNRYLITPKFNGKGGCDAGAEFFGITREESEFLFSPEEYEIPDDDGFYFPNEFTEVHGTPVDSKAVTAAHVAARVGILIDLYTKSGASPEAA